MFLLWEPYIFYMVKKSLDPLQLLPTKNTNSDEQSDKKVSNFYRPAFTAVLVHLFLTILPLVWANYAVLDVSTFTYINELSVYFSSAITHFLYVHIGCEGDRLFNQYEAYPDQQSS